jgi:hypothetical protein
MHGGIPAVARLISTKGRDAYDLGIDLGKPAWGTTQSIRRWPVPLSARFGTPSVDTPPPARDFEKSWTDRMCSLTLVIAKREHGCIKGITRAECTLL